MRKSQKQAENIRNLLKYIKPYKSECIGAMVLTIFESILEIFIPFLMNYLLTMGVYFDAPSGRYTINYTNLIFIASLMIACAILAFASGLVSVKLIAVTGRGFGAELRKATYKKIEDFSFNNIDELRQSSLITRLTDDNQIIQNAFCVSFRPLFRAPVQLVFAIVFSLIISPTLSIVLLVAMPILALSYLVILKEVKPRYRALQVGTDNLNNLTKEAIKNVKTIKSYVKEDYEIKKFNDVNDDLRKTSINSYKLSALNMPIMNLILFSTIIGILYFGGYFVINKEYNITTVNIASFLTYLSQVLGCFRMLNNVFTQINRAEASLVRTNEVLVTPIDLRFNNESKLKITSGDVVFKHVNFRYAKNAQNLVLHDINLHIKSGEFLGVVGETGSGKTTLISLINRFYDVSEGELLIDRQNIKEYNEHELHEKVSLSFQSPLLFKGTILDNLKFGNTIAPMDRIIKACKISDCYDFIMNDLDKNFSTMISEGGTSISGGQRQRICIARALINNPKVLILDDSFSALDHLTENTVKDNINKYLKDTTKIVISQKISAIKKADRIVVLKDGTISHIGTHKELYVLDPIYKDMCDLQKEAPDNE